MSVKVFNGSLLDETEIFHFNAEDSNLEKPVSGYF
jgi:hypothetical protein